MADALGVLHIVVARFGNGYENIGVQNVFQIENQIFGPAHLAGELQMMVCQNIPAVELVPQHAVEEGCGLLHQAQGKGIAVVDALGQEAVFTDIIRLFLGIDAKVLLQVFQCLRGLGRVGGNHHPVRCNDQIGVVRFGSSHQPLGKIRVEIIVAVHKLHILALCKGHAAVAGLRHTGIGFVHQNDAGVLFTELLTDGKAFVPGPVVDQNDLDILPCLGTNALQTAGNTILHVVHRHDNADEWVVHDGRSPLYGYYTFILKITECILTNKDTSPLGQSYL